MRNGPAIYQLNGGGRDTYIFNNNGGFCLAKEPTKYNRPGKMLTNQRFERRLPSLPGRPHHYQTDGTGRDIYILNDHGGF